jgi:uncharacterized protein
MSVEYTPLKQSERIVLIDALRGLAILGILMVNMRWMSEPITQNMLGTKPDASLHQVISESFIKFFFEGKFYVLFSMLFGFGFWIFMNKAAEKGLSIISVFGRRLFFLLLFGLAHMILLWAGDILIFYALFGFILILYRNVSNRKIFKWAVWLTLIPTILLTLMVTVFSLLSQNPEAKTAIDAVMQQGVDEIHQLVEQASVIYSGGSFSEIVSVRVQEFKALLSGILFFYPVVLGMFLLGVWAARKGVISDYIGNLSLFRKMFWWGLAIGIVTNTLFVIASHHAVPLIPSGWSLLATSMHTFGGVSFGLCYVSAIVLLVAKGKSALFYGLLAPVGRMALTNYLLHSIIGAFLFHSYGFGLYGKIEVWQGIVLTIVIFSIQIPFSRWWLNHFQFGPFEWLWRCLTYLKFQPLLRDKNLR